MNKILFPALMVTALAASPCLAAGCDTAFDDPTGSPGQFDSFLLSLSWAPQFCTTKAGISSADECDLLAANGARASSHGLVVHGLWPQYNQSHMTQTGGKCGPFYCDGKPGPNVTASPAVATVSAVMLGSALRRHEWDKHGTCISPHITQDQYFQTISRLTTRFGMARQFKPGQGKVAAMALRTAWAAKGVPASAVTLTCKQHHILEEVHICLDNQLNPRACTALEKAQSPCGATVVLQ